MLTYKIKMISAFCGKNELTSYAKLDECNITLIDKFWPVQDLMYYKHFMCFCLDDINE